MSLSIGIIGLPNVGKSTLFNALLSRQIALTANYPFATIEPNVGVVDVPDDRLDRIAEITKLEYTKAGNSSGNSEKEIPEKIIPTVVKFVDIAGLVKGAAEGEGLGNKFLSHIREVDALAHVVRDFQDENITRAGSISPEEDIEIINTELILADLQTLSKRIEAEQRESRTGNKESFEKLKVYEQLDEVLNRGELVFGQSWSESESVIIGELHLLTSKPVIYIVNVSEDALSIGNKNYMGRNYIHISARLESELASLPESEKQDYMDELGIHVTGLDKIIKRGYEILGLETYFTAGPKEVRAWTIKKGTNAPQAAGKIHSDFERGFISAEVIAYGDFVKAGGWKNARENGLVRTEGKSYLVKDGDIVLFRFSV